MAPSPNAGWWPSTFTIGAASSRSSYSFRMRLRSRVWMLTTISARVPFVEGLGKRQVVPALVRRMTWGIVSTGPKSMAKWRTIRQTAHVGVVALPHRLVDGCIGSRHAHRRQPLVRRALVGQTHLTVGRGRIDAEHQPQRARVAYTLLRMEMGLGWSYWSVGLRNSTAG